MSDLQWELIAIGVVVLVAVMAYNAWVVRKSGGRVRHRDDAVPRTDAGDDGAANAVAQRLEPSLDGVAALDAAGGGAAEPGLDMSLLSVADKKTSLDPLIDVLAPLALEAQVSGDAVLAALPGSRRVGTKPFAIEGENVATQTWEVPRAGERYQALQAGVQLANRSGALNEIEFSEFVHKAQTFADTLGATPDFPDMRHEVVRARELDQFASAHDAQLGFMLRAGRSAWSPGYVTQSAKAVGFVPGAMPGRLVLLDSQGQWPVINLQFDTQAALADDPEQSVLREVNLSLDVAQVTRNERPYQRLCESALALAERMSGAVTDDNGNTLSEEAMARIGADLEALYDALDARDLSAGSPQARRLFS